MNEALKDLEFVQQFSKQGLLENTTKCCATGTCANVGSVTMSYPLIPTDCDILDPVELSREVSSPFI